MASGERLAAAASGAGGGRCCCSKAVAAGRLPVAIAPHLPKLGDVHGILSRDHLRRAALDEHRLTAPLDGDGLPLTNLVEAELGAARGGVGGELRRPGGEGGATAAFFQQSISSSLGWRCVPREGENVLGSTHRRHKLDHAQPDSRGVHEASTAEEQVGEFAAGLALLANGGGWVGGWVVGCR